MLRVVRYRGKCNIYSYSTVQYVETKAQAIRCIELCKVFEKYPHKYLVCSEKFNLKEYFENKDNKKEG